MYVAANGAEAIEKSEKTAYNVALLDIKLPDIEGVKLLKLMRDSVPKTRKIMITGYPSMQNAISALNNDADAYLVKPVDPEKLLTIVKEQLQLQKEEIECSQQKVAEFIETRVRELTASPQEKTNYSSF